MESVFPAWVLCLLYNLYTLTSHKLPNKEMIACEAAQLLHFPNPSDNLKECQDNINK